MMEAGAPELIVAEYRVAGLSPEVIAELIAEVRPLWHEQHLARLTARPRRRAVGAGAKHKFVFVGRLLATLVSLGEVGDADSSVARVHGFDGDSQPVRQHVPPGWVGRCGPAGLPGGGGPSGSAVELVRRDGEPVVFAQGRAFVLLAEQALAAQDRQDVLGEGRQA